MLSRVSGILLCVFYLSSCHLSSGGAGSDSWPGVGDSLAAKLEGTYSGKFKNGLLSLAINYISGKTVSGYDVHKGLRRNVNGELTIDGSRVNMVLKEPGGRPSDGTFFITLDTATLKVTGKWVPTDSSKVHSGELRLARVDSTVKQEMEYVTYEGKLGSLSFNVDGTCELQYYPNSPDSDVHAQLITIRGNFDKKVDTFRIEWEQNKRLPTLQMRLVRYPPVEGADSSPYVPATLKGNGVEFIEVEGP